MAIGSRLLRASIRAFDQPQTEALRFCSQAHSGCQTTRACRRSELSMNDKVVLFYPPYAGPPLGPPLSLLSLATPLLEAGFRVSIVDGSIDRHAERTLAREIPDALCLGISLLTGPMIRTTIAAARLARDLRPDLPIVFGGWHPSLLPDQTLEHRLVDIVVRGQGEKGIVETAHCLQEEKSLESVRGISFKSDGRIVHNPERPVENINN